LRNIRDNARRDSKRDSKRDLKRDSKRDSKRDFGKQRNTARYKLPKDAVIDYKNISLLQRYLNDRGKILPRRITDVSAKEQRLLVTAIKKARFLAILSSGGVKSHKLAHGQINY
jgi:small subunit ribosomal protein S18